jgi:L-lysine exporter family protein LysE/ArgO
VVDAVVNGFGLGFGLILAIGAQNAFVLRQGIRGQHVFMVVLACSLSDAVLIAVGVGGFAQLVAQAPAILPVVRYGAAAFLLIYGAMAFWSAWRGVGTLEPATDGVSGGWAVLGSCLTLTWLNPHVYLDTVVLLGSVSARYPEHKLAFGFGACAASFVFFFALGYGARLLAPVFARPRAWQVLDLGVGAVMFIIAIKLLIGL